PFLGPLHVSLNTRESTIKLYHPFFNLLYKKILRKQNLSLTPPPWMHAPQSITRPIKSTGHKFFVLNEIMKIGTLPTGYHTKSPPKDCDINIEIDQLQLYGKVLICGHGYHNECFQKMSFKCHYCLDYLVDGINVLSSSYNDRLETVCKYCSEKNGGAQAAALIPGCYTTNKAILCRSHLSNCINFKNAFNNDEISEILSRPNKPKRQKNITNDTSTASSIIQKQPLISGYLRRPMSQKDIPYLENLILRMCVSNGLPFSFIENEDTKAFFNFLAPGIELPTRKKLAAKFNPDRVNVTRTNGIPNIPVDRRTTRNNKRRLPDDIVDSINDPHNKVLAMSQIRKDLFVNENHETNDDDFLENNNESVNSNSDENVNQWNIIVAHWRDEASQENQLENHSDESLLEEDLDNDFLVGVNNIHPADNVNLKWELSYICDQLTQYQQEKKLTRKDAEFYDIVFSDQLDKNTISKRLEDIREENNDDETEKKEEIKLFLNELVNHDIDKTKENLKHQNDIMFHLKRSLQ
ncbi:6414_t:CDS:2, partial [Entrophospora sp. SA101]